MKPLSVIIGAAFLLNCIGCSAWNIGAAPGGMRISSVRPAPHGIQVVEKSIPRRSYIQALEGSRGSGNLRIVPLVVAAHQAPASPEFRIFNVRKGGVGEILGLDNADVLVAAHDYVIRDPYQFYAYLQALAGETTSQIEIRRDGKPLLMKYSFSD